MKTDRARSASEPASAKPATQVDPSVTAPLSASVPGVVEQLPAQKLESSIAPSRNPLNDPAVPLEPSIALQAANFPIRNAPAIGELTPAPHGEQPLALHPRALASPSENAAAPASGSPNPAVMHPLAPKPHAAEDSPDHTTINSTPAHSSELSPASSRISKSPLRASAAPAIAEAPLSHTASSAAMPVRDELVSVTPRPIPTLQSPAVPSAQKDTFEALDATAAPPPTWIHASAHHAEAGYLDPSLGWVSVRADANAVGLHAAIVPPSPEAASTLSTHLAGLNAYLAEHHGHSATATLAPEPGDSSGSYPGNSMGREQGHPQQPHQNGSQTAQRSDSTTTLPTHDSSAAGLRILPSESVVPALNGSGVLLSVLA